MSADWPAGPPHDAAAAVSKLKQIRIRGYDGQDFYAMCVGVAEKVQLADPSVRVQVELMSRLDFEDVRRDVHLVDDGASPIILYDSRYIGGVWQLLERVAKDYPGLCSNGASRLKISEPSLSAVDDDEDVDEDALSLSRSRRRSMCL